MRALGANVVRIHLQYHQFMETPNSPNENNLARLRNLVDLAQSLGIYLDVTGLGSYRPANDPSWYVNLSERPKGSSSPRSSSGPAPSLPAAPSCPELAASVRPSHSRLHLRQPARAQVYSLCLVSSGISATTQTLQ
jgi:hypothetical protein